MKTFFKDAQQNNWDQDLVSLGLSDREMTVAEVKKTWTGALNAAREEVGLRIYDQE